MTILFKIHFVGEGDGAVIKTRLFRWVEVTSYQQMSELAANLLRKQLIRKPNSVLGLATGGSPIGFYQQLRHAYEQGDIDFSQVTTFNLDEYIGLPSNHPMSYQVYMENQLFQHVNVSSGKTHLPNVYQENLQLACENYDELIKKSGGIDWQLLGIGHNGHIGFNEPKTPFTSRTHIVRLTEETRRANARFFSHPDEVPREAMTMGIQTILEAEEIVLLAFGKSKEQAVTELQNGSITEDFPASILRTHPNVTVIYGSEKEE